MNKITAKEYFEKVKDSKHKLSDGFLDELERNTTNMLNKAYLIGQDYAIRKLMFALNVITKEKHLHDIGINTFVYKEDINKFIETVDGKHVKIIELEGYPREIPDDIAESIVKLKEDKVFDKFFIVFTDYTGKVEKRVKKERDPIIFGVFTEKQNLSDRFYYVGDWEDEYCDLTLQKMVDTMSRKGNEIERKVFSSTDPKAIKRYLENLDGKKDGFVLRTYKKTLFQRVKTWMSR